MTKTRPDPDSEYLSKYILDFNKRELNRFFHPERYPKAVLSVAALGIVAFFFIAWMFPLKNQLLETQFQKNPASASQEKELQNLTIAGPLTIKKSDNVTILVTSRSDLKAGSSLLLDLNYPADYLEILSAKPLNVVKSESKLVKNNPGKIVLSYKFPGLFQTTGAQQELLAVTFKTKMAGRVNITIGEDTKLLDSSNNPISLWNNNYTLLVTD